MLTGLASHPEPLVIARATSVLRHLTVRRSPDEPRMD